MPIRLVEQRDDGTGGIAVGGHHEPPESVPVLGGESEGCALQVQPRPKDGLGVGEIRVCGVDAVEDIDPVQQRGGRQHLEVGVDVWEHSLIDVVLARERGECAEPRESHSTSREGFMAPNVLVQVAFETRSQPGAEVLGHRPAIGVRDGQQVGGEHR